MPFPRAAADSQHRLADDLELRPGQRSSSQREVQAAQQWIGVGRRPGRSTLSDLVCRHDHGEFVRQVQLDGVSGVARAPAVQIVHNRVPKIVRPGNRAAGIDALQQLFLQCAVMGKLVPQDSHDEPTSSFLAVNCSKKTKPIDDAEKPFEIPLSWTWLRLSQITELITSGSRGWARYLATDGAKFISMTNLSRGSYALRLTNMRYVKPPTTQESVRSKVQAKDVLISITGDIGHLGRVPEDFGTAYINQHIALVRFIPQCRNRYFPEVLRSSMAVLQLNAPQRGIKNSVRLSDLRNMLIPLPPR